MLAAPDIAIQLIQWLPRFRLRQTGAAGLQGLPLKLFLGELAEQYPAIPDDDLTEQVECFLTSYPNWRDWYAMLIDTQDFKFSFFYGDPQVSQTAITAWRRTVTAIDSDALVTWELVRKKQHSQLFRLTKWRTYPLSDDKELHKLYKCNTGLADTHVHLEGSECMPWLWQRLMAEETRVEQLPRYSSDALSELLPDRRKHNARESERNLMKQAIKDRNTLLAACQDDGGFTVFDPPVPPNDNNRLWNERALLVWAWARAEATKNDRCFERYLTAKNIFLRNHTQSFGENPGLFRFRDFFNRTREFHPRQSPRVKALRIGRLVDCAHDSRHLRALTVRISPFDHFSEYARFFDKVWEKMIISSRDKDESIRFIVHFIRDPKQETKGAIPFEQLYQRLDRQSAALHLFRLNYPELAKYIVGIDVANFERKCPPSIFTPYFRLLRGDMSVLEKAGDDNPYCDNWRRLQRQGLAVHPVDLPQLMFTYHAGEDFFHPIDGMRMMDEVIYNAGFVGGDRIGHGLAAGWNIEAFNNERGMATRIPQGILFDNLVWLYDKLCAINYDNHHQLRKIAELIRHYSVDIYGCAVEPNVAFRLLSTRHNLPESRLTGDVETMRLWGAELHDDKCKSERRKTINLPQDFIAMTDVHNTVQEHFLAVLAKKRIVVEFNPSSNVAVGHFRHLKDHPLFRYLEIQKDGLQASINTDDPGVFATRIELEYALILDAMLVNGMNAEESYKTLERLRKCGVV
ncbi:MAG: hypothetical protein RW306_06760 [Geobacteraceae bacterium]|nr:hypothetical protein [Geobacteraceae bacterium]